MMESGVMDAMLDLAALSKSRCIPWVEFGPLGGGYRCMTDCKN